MPDLTADLFQVRDLLGSAANEGRRRRPRLGCAAGRARLDDAVARGRDRDVSDVGGCPARPIPLAARGCRAHAAGVARGSDQRRHVRTITTGIPTALKRLGVADKPGLVADTERDLVPFAVESSVAAVRRKLARLRLSLDPDGTDEGAIARTGG